MDIEHAVRGPWHGSYKLWLTLCASRWGRDCVVAHRRQIGIKRAGLNSRRHGLTNWCELELEDQELGAGALDKCFGPLGG